MPRYAKFDAVRCAALMVDFTRPATPAATATMVFVNEKTGTSFGSAEMTRWSPETLQRLAELRASVEQDVEALMFDDGITTTMRAPQAPAEPPAGGLGEFLANKAGDPPQG